MARGMRRGVTDMLVLLSLVTASRVGTHVALSPVLSWPRELPLGLIL